MSVVFATVNEVVWIFLIVASAVLRNIPKPVRNSGS